MEILRFLISFFAKEYGGGKFAELFNLLDKYDFDIKKAVGNVTPDDLSPVVESFMKKEDSPTDNVGEFRLEPIKDLADKDIIYALNGYLS